MTRRRVTIWVVVLAVLIGLVVGADRLAHRAVQNFVAEQLQSELGLDAAPTVKIGGFGFLNQVIRQRFSTIEIGAGEIDPAGAIPVSQLKVVVRDVAASDFFQTLVAEELTGTTRLDYAALAELTPAQLSYAGTDAQGRGRVKVEIGRDLFGRKVTATLSGVPELDTAKQTLIVVDPQVTVGGVPVPEAVAKTWFDTIFPPIPIAGLPLDLKLSAVSATAEGIDATVTGQRVTLTQG